MNKLRYYLPAALLFVSLCVVADARPFSAAQQAAVQRASLGVVPSGSIGSADIASSAVTGVKIGAGAVSNTHVAASAAIARTKLGTDGNGTVVAAAASVAEQVGMIHSTVITMTNVAMVATDGSDEGESTKVMDMPGGAITIIGAVANMTSVVSAGATNTYVMACGTAAAADDGTLTGTEANVIPSTSIDTTGGTVLTNSFDAVLAAPVTIDGTSSAMDVYVNWGIDNDDMDADVTNTVTGTLTLYWINAGDN